MPKSFSLLQVLAMEQAAARAWPASRLQSVDGWRVRLSGGGSRRANSVLPLEFNGDDPEHAIDRVERLYHGERLRCYFQVSSIARPDDLDQRLAVRGYAFEEPCLLMAKRLVPSSMPVNVVVTDVPTADWLSVYTEPLDAPRKAAVPAVLENVPHPRGFLLLREGGRPISSALSVVSPDGIAVIECVATMSSERRSGGAKRIMDALECWSFDHGAKIAALQVVESNVAACLLYQRRGYAVVGGYHYRYKDVLEDA
jgi:ribosomal protein S18 acetylase RimI-like enzyme